MSLRTVILAVLAILGIFSLERGSNLSARAAADHFKTVVDETGVSLVLAGLPRFQQIIDHNEQLRDRAAGTVYFAPYDWQKDEERDAFAGAVEAVLLSLEKSGASGRNLVQGLSKSAI